MREDLVHHDRSNNIEFLLYTRQKDIISVLSELTFSCGKQIIMLKKYYRLRLSDMKEIDKML